jgi:hypothetical protein
MDETSRIRSRIRIHRPEAWIRGSVSIPKCHGSTTLVLKKTSKEKLFFKLFSLPATATAQSCRGRGLTAVSATQTGEIYPHQINTKCSCSRPLSLSLSPLCVSYRILASKASPTIFSVRIIMMALVWAGGEGKPICTKKNFPN